MAPKAPPPPQHPSMDLAVDVLLQRWTDYAPEIGLFIFVLLGALRVKQGLGKDLYWAQSLVLTFLVCFGGGIIAPFLLGNPPAILVNDFIVPITIICWILVNRIEGAVSFLTTFPLIKSALMVMAEIFRGNGCISMVIIASAALKAGPYYPIPVWGPILLGTIAGCGGLFLPLDRGLKGLEAGAPWTLQSAFYGAFAYHLATSDPNVRPYIIKYVGEYSAESARAAVIAGFAGVALLQSLLGPNFNPFTPIHVVLYKILGIKAPKAAEAPKVKTS